jgi:ribose transport system ATP-binding protein
VLRSGRLVGTITGAEASEERLVEMMTGRRIDALFPHVPHSPQAVRLRLENFATKDGRIRNVTIEVKAGEAVGIAGLVGCGKSEVGRAAFGLESISAGTLTLDGRAVDPRSPRQMLNEGLCYFPSDRNGEGLAIERSVLENSSIAALGRFSKLGWLDRSREREDVKASTERLALRPAAIDIPVAALSGGNRQKVMLARGLLRDLSVYVFDEPTVGIDVGAKVEVYQFIADLVSAGAAVIVISSELSEVIALSNRVYVMHEGQVVRELEGAQKNQENILSAFFGNQASISVEHRA